MKIKMPLQLKLRLYLLPFIVIILGITIIIISKRIHADAEEEAVVHTNQLAEEYSFISKTKLIKAESLSQGIEYGFRNIDLKSLNNLDQWIKRTLMSAGADHSEVRSFWLSLELSFIDSTYSKDFGRKDFTAYRDNSGNLGYIEGFSNMEGDEPGSIYHQLKNNMVSRIEDPYRYAYADDPSLAPLQTSISVPIAKDGKFLGVVGVDYDLDELHSTFKGFDVENVQYVALLSNNGTIVSLPKEDKIGTLFSETFDDWSKNYDLGRVIKEGSQFNFIDFDPLHQENSYVSLFPVETPGKNTPWSVLVSITESSVMKEAKSMKLFGIVMVFVASLIISIVLFFISRLITKPLKDTTETLSRLSKGEIDQVNKLSINTGDEIEEMAQSANDLIEGLNNTAQFAKKIGSGSLEVEFKPLSDSDVLGNSLNEMRNSLAELADRDMKRKAKEEITNWAINGEARMGEIMRQSNKSIKELTYSLLKGIIDYVEVVQGAVFVASAKENEEEEYVLSSAIAYSREKIIDSTFLVGEGLVGRCAYEKLPIYMEDVPESYINITSGLGEANPRCILLIPAMINGKVEAIVELVSFNKLKQYQIDFLLKIGESLASTIANAKINEQTNALLERSKMQSEELAAQEEEMRQNLEELMATQEEVSRLRQEELDESKKKEEEHKKQEKAFLSLIDHIPHKIFLKDKQGRMHIANKAVVEAHGEPLEEILGKTDFDFMDNKQEAQEIWEAEQTIINTNTPLEYIHTELVGEEEKVLHTVKSPFYIDFLGETGILGVQRDITKETNYKTELDKALKLVESLKQ